MGRTHLLLGINALWALRLAPGPPGTTGSDFGLLYGNDLGPLACAAALGALLPDLDAANSLIRRPEIVRGVRPFAPLARITYQALGHRGPLHSLLGLALTLPAAWALAYGIGWRCAAALLLGYATHLLGDAATKSGIPLLYPDTTRRHLLPPALRLTTGSQAEDVVLALLAAGAFLLVIPLLLQG